MKAKNNYKPRKERFILIYLLLTSASALFSLELNQLSSNVLYADSAIPALLWLGVEIAPIFIWAHLFIYTINSFRSNDRTFPKFILISTPVLIFIKNLIILFLQVTMDKIPINSVTFEECLLNFLFYFPIEIAQFLVTYFITYLVMKKKKEGSAKISALFSSLTIAIILIINRIENNIAASISGKETSVARIAIGCGWDLLISAAIFLVTVLALASKKNKLKED